jgi:hypothetical protein
MLLSTETVNSAATHAYGLFLIVAISIAGATGCWRSEMGTVTGTVTQAGLPVRDAEVTFLTSGRPTSVGTTDAEGRFTLSTRRLNDGAYAGQHVVVITKSPPSARPDKYQSPDTTPLRADVVAGQANTVTFDLSQ